MKKIQLSLLACMLGLGGYAQTIEDIEILNARNLHGTGRYVAMGGAFLALGNDFSAMHQNPAASSVFRKNAMGFTFGFQGQTNQTQFLNNNQEYWDLHATFENFGLVAKFGPKDKYTFGFTIDKLADFNSDFTVLGDNVYQSTNPFTGQESGITLGEYWNQRSFGYTIGTLEYDGLMEEASAISSTLLLLDSVGGVATYDYYVDDASQVAYRFHEVGATNEYNFNFGIKSNKKLDIGFGLGIPHTEYQSRSTLTENGFADSSYIVAYDLQRDNYISSVGVNLKAGLIYRPYQFLRLAASIQTRTMNFVQQTYTTYVDAYSWDRVDYRGDVYEFDAIEYHAHTPAIYRAGLAFVLSKHVALSGEVEHTNPKKVNLSAKDGDNYEGEQDYYNSVTQSSTTVKSGAEFKVGNWYGRLGYQFRNSNFKNADLFYSDQSTYAFGIGYKNQDFGIDVTYSQSSYTQNQVVHPYLGSNTANAFNGDVIDIERALVQNDIRKGNLILGVQVSF